MAGAQAPSGRGGTISPRRLRIPPPWGIIGAMRHATQAAATTILETDWGFVGLAISPRGLLGLELPVSDRAAMVRRLGAAWPGADSADSHEFAELGAALHRYFHGAPLALADALDLSPWTPFQRHVWHVVATIEHGQTRTFGWVAGQLGMPRGLAAVGQAIAANPLPILIPTHRVLPRTGDILGAASDDHKRYLLAVERGERPLFPPAFAAL